MTPISLEEKIRGCIERHPDWDNVRIANSIGTRRGNIAAFREGRALNIAVLVPIAATSTTPPTESGLISLDKVLQRYDVRSAILRELALIPKGKLISEVELCQRAAGMDKNRFRRTVENNEAEFRLLRIKLRLDDSTDGRWYWGAMTDIAEAQKIRDL